MSLLLDIQSSIISDQQKVGSVLLKLRLLASRLGSTILEEWVQHEIEGYPESVDVPQYRIVNVSYSGTFSGPFGSGINNAPIPPYLIAKYAHEKWVNFEIRQSLAAVESLLAEDDPKHGTLQINAANLILALQGNVYEGYACNSITGTFSKSGLVQIQNSVRNKILELTIAIEKNVPNAMEIDLGKTGGQTNAKDVEKVTTITHQIIGSITNINNSGTGAQISVHVAPGDKQELLQYLTSNGIEEADAKEFIEVVSSEKSNDKDQPFGEKAKQWVAKNIGKAMGGSWKIAMPVASQVLTEAALRYYGLK